MKKIFTLLLTLCFLAPVYAQNYDKAIEKAQKKEVKQKMKDYKKAGYEIMGSRTMEVALNKHYGKLNELGDNGLVFDGISRRTKSKNIGEQMAINNATIKYAQKAGSTVKGRVVSDGFANGVDAEGEFDKFYAAYERLVEQKVKNALNPSYSICKTNADGTYEIQAFFIVDESIARVARNAALEAALKDTNLAQKYAEKVRAFANDKVSD
ncbi:MAG: hypothetical protein K2J49_06210 [Muribaculaceae bacterium]|nr:hypothetical protein [Muribaculaceae bacterium]